MKVSSSIDKAPTTMQQLSANHGTTIQSFEWLSLLDLPLEIRRSIYQEILVSPEPIGTMPESSRDSMDPKKNSLLEGIFWASRQLRSEAQDAFLWSKHL